MRARNTATKKGKQIGTLRRHLLPMATAMCLPKNFFLVTVGLLVLSRNAWADVGNVASDRHLFAESVKAVDSIRVVRTQVTSQELAAPQSAMITLGLRNVAELDTKIQKGEIVSVSEMEARYYPTHDTWAAVANWALSQGLRVAPEDGTHMSVMTRGQVSQVANAFQVRFARVRGDDGIEYTSAISIPSTPSGIAEAVTGILRLQPHLRPHPATTYPEIGAAYAYGPQFMLDQYGATGIGDGTGQIIAIFGFNSPPNAKDLATYWAKIGSPHTTADVTIINPNNYPVYNDDTSNGIPPGYEVTGDIEIVSGLCPGAQIRVYCLNDYASTAQAVLSDLKQFPNIHQLSFSSAEPEAIAPTAASQYFMALAAQGVTTFAPSGDGGSNPDLATQYLSYNPNSPLSAEYPASDPYVTGVGGTEQVFSGVDPDNSKSTITGVKAELAWTEGTNPEWVYEGTPEGIGGGSGGGISQVFARPSWQTGPGVPTGTMRCVPDVAAAAAANGGLYTYVGGDEVAGGTSESAPIWAALCAILNQSLQLTGHTPIGLLGPKIYPLAGTGAMNYVTQGYLSYEGKAFSSFPLGALDTNGAYNVGPTYDLITGIGIPNVAQIAAALEAPPAGLSVNVSSPLPSAPLANGSVPITLTASTTGSPTSYQWYLNGVAIAGATGATEVVYPTAGNQGAYSVVVTNSAGSASTTAGTLTVTTNAWIVNLSARAYVKTGANLLIAGFVTTGNANKSLLIRGDGPTLAGFGISDFLPDPQLTLIDSAGTSLVSTEGWAASLDSSFSHVGAFSLTPGSHDTALLELLAPGAYTAQVISQTTNNGVALAEIYDADNGAPMNRLINISARAAVGTGANILIGGFVIGGSTSQTVIIRGDGPGLAAFGVPGTLTNPVLTLFDSSGAIIATDTGWNNAPVPGGAATSSITIQPLTSALSAKVGAFSLASGSADSAIVATLPAGAYTAQVAGANNSSGVALVEIYELR